VAARRWSGAHRRRDTDGAIEQRIADALRELERGLHAQVLARLDIDVPAIRGWGDEYRRAGKARQCATESSVAAGPRRAGQVGSPAMIVINLAGILVCAISLIVAVGISDKLGSGNNDLAMMLSGLLLVAIDVGYRRVRGLKLLGWRGPAIFWLPAWIWGVLAFGSGLAYLVQRR
jgi:hypothetical protein